MKRNEELEKLLTQNGFSQDEKCQWYRINQQGKKEEPHLTGLVLAEMGVVSLPTLKKNFSAEKQSGKNPQKRTVAIYNLNKIIDKLPRTIDEYPDLLSEYLAPPLNKLPANQVLATTGNKLKWKCEKCNHIWEAQGYNRLIGTSCPACANQTVTSKNNITVTHPELAAEYLPPPYNELPANKIIAGTNKLLWWQCAKCKHDWKAPGSGRADGRKCPACTGRVSSKNNNLAVTNPDLAEEYLSPPDNPLPADKVLISTHVKLKWKCKKCGHVWEAFGYNRKKGQGCPACANRVATQTNNMAITHPQLAKDYLAPPHNKLPASQILGTAYTKFWWQCSKCQHIWIARGSERAKGHGCPACSGRVVTKSNNLATLYPDLVEEYLPPPHNVLEASQVLAGTSKKLKWHCNNGHIWSAAGSTRIKGHGCPFCAIEKRRKHDSK